MGTIPAWIDGGTEAPQAKVHVELSEHDTLMELTVEDPVSKFVGTVLLDHDGVVTLIKELAYFARSM